MFSQSSIVVLHLIDVLGEHVVQPLQSLLEMFLVESSKDCFYVLVQQQVHLVRQMKTSRQIKEERAIPWAPRTLPPAGGG